MVKQLLYGLTFVMFAAMAVAAYTELAGSDDASAIVVDPVYNETVTAAGTQMSTLTALQATAESAHIMATQIGELTVQNQHLQGTISAMSVINGGQPQQFANAPEQAAVIQSQNQAPPAGGQPQGDVPPATGSSSDPDLAAQTVNQINQQGQIVPTSTPHLMNATPLPNVETFAQVDQASSPNGIVYNQPTTASMVNNADGCASDTISTFDPDAAEIYMTIVAHNVVQGALFNVQWLRNGEFQFESAGWAADQDYDQICIWFSAVGPFESGNWTAEFTEEGQVVGSHDFYITGEETMVEAEPTPGS